MGLRKEVREFMQEYRNRQKRKDTALKFYREMINRLESQNEELHDRLMSRNLPELKTFQLSNDDPTLELEEIDPMEDENLAGEVVDIKK